MSPESITTHHGIGLAHIFLFAFEELFGQLIESIVCEACVTYDNDFMEETCNLHLHDHVINREYPFAIGQLGKFLIDTKVFYEIDVATPRNGQLATFHLIGRVLQNVDVAAESEVLLVVGKKLQMDATVAIYLDGVLYIESVEADGSFAIR